MDQEHIQLLIARCRQHDTAAFTLLVAEYQAMVFRLAFRLLCDEDEARDMVQETFIKVWISLDKYNAEYRFSTWLYKVTCHICYDRLRALQHSPQTDSNLKVVDLPVPSTDDNIEATLVNRELRELIVRFTGELTPKQKLVFTLRDLEELEIGDIEAITGLSRIQIKTNLYLARKNIRMKLDKINVEL